MFDDAREEPGQLFAFGGFQGGEEDGLRVVDQVFPVPGVAAGELVHREPV